MQIFTSSVINLNFHAKLSLRVEWLKIGKSNIYDFWNLHYIFFYLELMEGVGNMVEGMILFAKLPFRVGVDGILVSLIQPE